MSQRGKGGREREGEGSSNGAAKATAAEKGALFPAAFTHSAVAAEVFFSADKMPLDEFPGGGGGFQRGAISGVV